MATVNINDKEISVKDGTLILEAARNAGFFIPTFCYQADLIGIGSCRMCIVEIEGQKKLQASCITPVMNGMNIYTETETVNEARAAMLEFLLANHGLDCPVCDKGGECELQDLVYRYGPHTGRYAEKKYVWHDKDYIISPVIIKNSNRCVQCMKCVRVCKEVVGRNVIDGLNRGEIQEETSFFKGMLDCDQDGNCIEVCPVGCFMRLPFRYKTRPWDLKGADTICPYCATGCRMVIEERDGNVIRSRAQLGVGLNSETLCARGRFGYDFIDRKDRLVTPLLKKNGKLVPATWEEAWAVIKNNLKPSDPVKTGGIASARLSNEELYLFQILIRNTLKSPNIDSSLRWDPRAVKAFISATRMYTGGVSVFDCMEADALLIIGSHLSDENPVTDYIVRRISLTGNITVMIASARAMKLDRSAGVTLRHTPGNENEVLEALTLTLAEFNTARLPADAGLDPGQKPGIESVVSLAGADTGTLNRLAQSLNNSASVSIMAGTEFLRFPRGTAGLSKLVDLLEMLGKRVLIMPVLDRCNQRGAWEMGVHPGLGPGYHDLQPAGFGHDAILAAAEKDDLESLYIIREDPMATYAQPEYVKQALSKLNFLLVQDIFLTETARLADCVLPGASFAEKEGTFTNQEGRVQSISPLMKPPGKAKTDLEIIARIGRLFDESFSPYTKRSAVVFEEIRNQVGMYANVSLSFKNQRNEANDLDNKPALVSDSSVKPPAEHFSPGPPERDEDSSLFTLVSGNHLFYSGRLAEMSDLLKGLLEEPTVEISIEDAAEKGVSSGEKVTVEGSRYKAVLTVKITSGSQNGVAFIAENFKSVPVNRFFEKGCFKTKVSISKV
jgi:NADH-quinone oxidoreductase subunit G